MTANPASAPHPLSNDRAPQTTFGPRPAAPAGWYDDAVNNTQRYWDGHNWTSHVAARGTHQLVQPAPIQQNHPQQGPVVAINNIVVINQQKSAGVAFLLTFFFGPLGMFYSTVAGAVIMVLVSIFGAVLVGLATFGLGAPIWLLICWFVSMIWGCIAASGSGSGSVTTVSR